MSANRLRLAPPQRDGLFRELLLNLRLILRLLRDQRVSAWVKLIPVGAVIYWLFPDLIIGPFDDMAVLWIALTIFVEMCPQSVVIELRQELAKIPNQAETKPVNPEAKIIDGAFQEAQDRKGY
jgi:uncharacterized membrane protein YkvA (DUF1232 family)